MSVLGCINEMYTIYTETPIAGITRQLTNLRAESSCHAVLGVGLDSLNTEILTLYPTHSLDVRVFLSCADFCLTKPAHLATPSRNTRSLLAASISRPITCLNKFIILEVGLILKRNRP
jgi:hypothetical protein